MRAFHLCRARAEHEQFDLNPTQTMKTRSKNEDKTGQCGTGA